MISNQIKTNSRLLLIALLLLFAISCSSFDQLESFREVGYVQTTIANVNDRTIDFSNGMSARADRIIIAVNSTPVLLILENYTGSGYFYLRQKKVGFTISQSQQDTDIDMLGLRRGSINYVQQIDSVNHIVQLADNSAWFVPNIDQWKHVRYWLTDPEIIVPENKPPSGEHFINTATAEGALVFKVDEPKTN